MTVRVVCGIDEAGYGPLLGPLTVASATLAAPVETAGLGCLDDAVRGGDAGLVTERLSDAPDLWAMLAPAVCPSPRAWRAQRRRGLVVADSKIAKLSNSSGGDDPLTHLERGVLAFLGVCRDSPIDEPGLFERLGVREPDAAWYEAVGTDASLPRTTTPEHLGVLARRLEEACARSGVRCLEMRCSALDETAFNTRYATLGVKSAVSFELVLGHVERVWRSSAAKRAARGVGPIPLIVVDRQGGRVRYAGLLARGLEGSTVTVVDESAGRSTYLVEGGSGGGTAIVTVLLRAEASVLSVALASMAAKWVRELLMRRFNRYWRRRFPELKPTAGYRPDGGRWLQDLAVLSGSPHLGLSRNA